MCKSNVLVYKYALKFSISYININQINIPNPEIFLYIFFINLILGAGEGTINFSFTSFLSNFFNSHSIKIFK